MRKSLLFAFLIFAMVSAAISPACAFIFGKSGDFIEICSGLKTIKIKVDGNEIPDLTGDDCPFCMQFHHIAAIHNDVFVLDGLQNNGFFKDFISEIALVTFLNSYHSRAPPVFS